MQQNRYPTSSAALLLIDMQYDFMDGGSLAVSGANEIIPTINKLLALPWKLIVASKDWHPHNHISFASNHINKQPFTPIILENGSEQMLWPAHCVQDSKGASLHTSIDIGRIEVTILKGQNPQVDSYSAFFDNNEVEKTALDDVLKEKGIDTLFVSGLAADYCVKFTALDGRKLGYNTYYIMDATKFVDDANLQPTVQQLEEAGVNIITTPDIIP